eukprot:g30748.t1
MKCLRVFADALCYKAAATAAGHGRLWRGALNQLGGERLPESEAEVWTAAVWACEAWDSSAESFAELLQRSLSGASCEGDAKSGSSFTLGLQLRTVHSTDRDRPRWERPDRLQGRWQKWQRGASEKWQKLQLLRQVLATLWMPTVLWGNTARSWWLPAMALSHTTLVLGMAHHAQGRLRRLQKPGVRLVSSLTSERPCPAPPSAWLRVLWASLLALNVTWTHLGALIYHYDRKA